VGGFMGGGSAPAPQPAPAPAPVVEKKEDPGEAVRRKRLAEGRASGSSTTGGEESGATKTLLGN